MARDDSGVAGMNDGDRRRVELLLPMRTVLFVAAAVGVLAAFAAIGDTFLIVFVGIFLGARLRVPGALRDGEDAHVARARRDGHRARDARSRVTALVLVLLRAARRGRARLPPGSADRPSSSCATRTSSRWLGDSGAAGNVQEGAEQVSVSVPDAISAVLGIAGDRSSASSSPPSRSSSSASSCSRDIANLKRALASVLMPGEEERWLGVWERVTDVGLALGDRRRRDRGDRRHDAGRDRLAARLELRDRARA